MGKYIDCHNCQNQYDCERTYLGGCTDGKEFEEEKKPTDEDIAQALLQNIAYGKAITYFDKWGNHNSIMIADIIDFINCLQSEKEELHEKRMDAEYAIDKWMKENAEQKSEIERLTEENEYLDGCAKQFLADYQKCEIANVELQELNAKYYNEAKDLRRENAELQKQVDWLKKDREAVFNEMSERMKAEVAIEKKLGIRKCEQTVKDTAKEIYELIDAVKEVFPNDYRGYDMAHGWSMCVDKLKEIIKSKGVEVE